MSKRAFFLIFVISLILLSACIWPGEKQRSINIGYFNNLTHAQALYMKSQSMCEKEFEGEYNVKWNSFNAGPAEVEALFAGQIDIAYIGPVPAIIANSKSFGDITVLSGVTMAGSELVANYDSGIEEVSDLDGKIVAIPQIGNTQHLCLLKILSDADLSTIENGGTVTVTAVENSDIQNMLDTHNIDAALVPEPWGSILNENGAKVILDHNEIFANGDYPVAVLAVRNDFLKSDINAVERFLKLHLDVTEEIVKNTQKVSLDINKEIEKATGKTMDNDILQKAISKISFSTEINKKSMSYFEDECKKQGFIKEKSETLYSEIPD